MKKENWTRPRRHAPKTLEELRTRMLEHAAALKKRGYDELAVDLEDEVNGDPEDADQDVYGRTLTESS